MAKVAIMTVKFYAGTSLEDAHDSAKDLAGKLDCHVEFKFNGVVCKVSKYSNYDEFEMKYEQALKTDNICTNL